MYLITGASRGIGQLLFDNLSSRGEICQGTYNSSSVTDHNNFSQVDVRSFDAVSMWVSGVVDQSNSDNLVLINCAGISYSAFGHKSDIDKWKNVIDVNLIGSFNLIRAVLPYMRAANYGRIINFSSVVAQKGVPGTSAYAASKSGLIGLTKSIAAEVAGRGITCNLIAPGFISTPMTDKLTDDQKNNIIKNIPVDRLGKPEDISSACLYLASEESSFVTGTTLHVNGGMGML
jgi:acetoacetyl-CoA reductase/3-oxoacyl-[acyl-carrier protein] reductase